MGLKSDLLDAITKASVETGTPPPDLSAGTFPERLAHYQTEAIAKFITEADFTITQLKAPVVVERMKTPDQGVNIQLETLLGDKAPILKTLKKVGGLIPGGGSVVNKLIDQLEDAIKQAIKPLLEGGATLPGFNIGKDDGALESTGYVYIGEDPDSTDSFDVDDENGQRQFTTVKIFREDIEELLK